LAKQQSYSSTLGFCHIFLLKILKSFSLPATQAIEYAETTEAARRRSHAQARPMALNIDTGVRDNPVTRRIS
jgi:hypothetical protein